MPVWREDGRELIFRSASGAPMAVDIEVDADDFQGRQVETALSDAAGPVDRDRRRQALPRLDASRFRTSQMPTPST